MSGGRARAGVRWLLHSLASKLVLLSVVFVLVPVLIYDQLREADEHKQALLLESAVRQGLVVARALAPTLRQADTTTLPRLGEELARFADSDIRLKLLLRPADTPDAHGFYYVAAAPTAPDQYLDLERQQLLDEGVLEKIAQSCSGNLPLAIRVPTPSGGLELLTSITPVNSPIGCWAVVTSNTTPWFLGTSLGRAYWRTPEIQVAALIYVAMALLVLALFAGIWSNLHRFGRLARSISGNGRASTSFAGQNTVPELRAVAENFDRLVETLRQSADTLRRAAEDNAHAFKTPIAVIRQSLEPVKRSIGPGDARALRALDMVERSLDRLDGLVSFARRLDETSADILDMPRCKVDLSQILDRLLAGYVPVVAERGLSLERAVESGLSVHATEEVLETVVENIIENAISFSPLGSTVTVRLERVRDRAVLTVADQGIGVDPANLEKIFERYFSQRESHPRPVAHGNAALAAEPATQEPHFGIGLWIVRRNTEALGGRVVAANRAEGGLEMRVELPLAM